MGKKTVVTLLTWMFAASLLTGCGEKTDITNQEIPENSSAVEHEADTDDSPAGESTGSEEAGGEEEAASDTTGTENESIVLFDEIAKYGDYEGQKDKTFEPVNDVLKAPEDVPVFNGDGIEVGYIKTGSTISITGSASNFWARFENPVEGTDYDYLYVMKDYITDGNLIALTTTELEAMIKESLGNRNYDAPVFTESTDDMELLEFRIPMYYNPETDTPVYWVYDYYYKYREEISILSYKTYSVVCTEDTDDYIICQIYYKDLITDEEFNNYGH